MHPKNKQGYIARHARHFTKHGNYKKPLKEPLAPPQKNLSDQSST